MHSRIARLLVGLYPRRWRERYAQEMLELLKLRPVTAWQLFDISRAIVRERVSHLPLSFVLWGAWGGGALLAAIGLVFASTLQRWYGTLPEFQPIFTPSPDGRLVYAPPIDTLGFISPVVSLLVLARAISVGYGRIKLRFTQSPKVRASEAWCWVVVLFAASTIHQLIDLNAQRGIPGYPAYSTQRIWVQSAMQVVVALQFLLSSSTWYTRRIERLRAIREARPSPPQIILGLNT
jgi:hypothetical protein